MQQWRRRGGGSGAEAALRHDQITRGPALHWPGGGAASLHPHPAPLAAEPRSGASLMLALTPYYASIRHRSFIHRPRDPETSSFLGHLSLTTLVPDPKCPTPSINWLTHNFWFGFIRRLEQKVRYLRFLIILHA